MTENTHSEPDYDANEEMIGQAQEVQNNIQEEKPVFSEPVSSDVQPDQVPIEADFVSAMNNVPDSKAVSVDTPVQPEVPDVSVSEENVVAEGVPSKSAIPQEPVSEEKPVFTESDFSGEIPPIQDVPSVAEEINEVSDVQVPQSNADVQGQSDEAISFSGDANIEENQLEPDAAPQNIDSEIQQEAPDLNESQETMVEESSNELDVESNTGAVPSEDDGEPHRGLLPSEPDYNGSQQEEVQDNIPPAPDASVETDEVKAEDEDISSIAEGLADQITEDTLQQEGGIADDLSNEMQAEEIMAMMNAEDNKSSGKKKSGDGGGLDAGMFGGGGDDDGADPFSKDFKLFDEEQSSDKSVDKEHPFTVTETTRIIISRFLLYAILTAIVPQVKYVDQTIHTASLFLVVVALISTILIRPLEKKDLVFKQYLRVALAIADMGVALILIYLSASSDNLLMLAFPLITLTNGIYGINFQLAFIAMLSTMLYYSAEIAIGDFGIDTFDFRTGFFIQVCVILWLITWNFILEWFKNNKTLRYELIKFVERAIEKLPKPILDKLSVIFSMEKLTGLEHTYQSKMEELDALIAKQETEIKFLKENLQGNGSEDYGVNEINSMLELENLSLKENNKKLMELNKSLESRVQMLSQELEIANTELERIYNSINEDGEGQESESQDEEMIADETNADEVVDAVTD